MELFQDDLVKMNREKKKTDLFNAEDFKLIHSFLEDDIQAFNRLVLKYKDRIFNLCYRFLGDYDEADDAAQESFVKVYRNLKKFKFESSFFTWLYRITVNTCKNKMSSLNYRINQQMIRLDKPRTSNNGVYPVEIENHTHSPDRLFERKEKQQLIQKAVNSLPGKQQRLVVLRDIEGLSYEEIVEITGYKLGTVKSKLSRARQLLRKKLKEVI